MQLKFIEAVPVKSGRLSYTCSFYKLISGILGTSTWMGNRPRLAWPLPIWIGLFPNDIRLRLYTS